MSQSSSTGSFIVALEGARSVVVQDLSRFDDRIFEPEPQLTVEGALRRSLELELPQNALIDRLEVVVTARPASATRAVDVAQLRVGGNGAELVLDFGTPRTVSIIRPAGGFRIGAVKSWNGMAFATEVGKRITSAGTAVLDEVRSERLHVALEGGGDTAALVGGALLVLPDAPADLELRIDEGPPAWRHAGAVRLEPGTTLSSTAFNENGERLADLTAALAALTGDPTRGEPRRFRLDLTSRTPGRLDLAAPDERRSLRRIWRATVEGEAQPRLAFAEEGERTLRLAAAVPESISNTEIRVTVKGAPQPERVVPPRGPTASDLVELVLDSNRAAIAQLPAASRLGALTGLRLPLAVAEGGAEASVALWTSTQAGLPDRPLGAGVSRAVALEAGPERWVSFALPGPVPLAPVPLWVSVLVARGKLVWRPTIADADDPAAGQLRTGPPSGPWYPLPSLFEPRAGNAFGVLRARLRLLGTPGPETRIAAVLLAAGADEVAMTPSEAGLRVAVPATGSAGLLRVTSAVAMTLTLTDIDLVTSG